GGRRHDVLGEVIGEGWRKLVGERVSAGRLHFARQLVGGRRGKLIGQLVRGRSSPKEACKCAREAVENRHGASPPSVWNPYWPTRRAARPLCIPRRRSG